MKMLLRIFIISFFLMSFSCTSKKEKRIIENRIDIISDSMLDAESYFDDVGREDDINETRNYKTVLDIIMQQDISLIPSNKLEEVIPRTSKEFAIFYDLFSKETSPSRIERPYHIADSLIALYAFRDSGDFFIRYLNMYYISDIDNSDEVYMENLFYGVDFAIDANYTEFIRIFNSMSNAQKECFSSFVK